MLEQRLEQLRDALEERGLHFHWQNLDERPGDADEASGALWRHGRAWLRPLATDPTAARPEIGFGAEWMIGELGAAFGLRVEDRELTLHGALPGISLWLHGEPLPATLGRALRSLAGATEREDVELGVRILGGVVSWELLLPTGRWRWGHAGGARWRSGWVRLVPETTFSSEPIGDLRLVDVPMPEGSYRWSVQMERCAVHSFLRRDEIVLRAHCEALEDQQIPIPGKGENSWDCGSDALSALTTIGAQSVEDAVGRIVSSVLETRRKRGVDADYAVGGTHDRTRAAS